MMREDILHDAILPQTLLLLFSRQDSDTRDTVKRREEEPRFFNFGKIDSYSLEYLLEV